MRKTTPSRAMNILLLNQYYPPDLAPTGRYLHDLAQQLVARGHAVTTLTSRSSYACDQRWPARETIDGVDVQRVGGLRIGRRYLLLRAIEQASFLLRLAIRLRRLRPTPDFILCLTTPPFLGALVRAIRRHRTPYGQWIMDLYPDVLFAHELVKPTSWCARRLAGLARYAARGGTFAVGLGPDMAARMAIYAGRCPVEAIPLWSLGAEEPPSPTAVQAMRRERGWADEDLILMYSGNMGRGHRFSEFLEAAAATPPESHLRWIFAGGGMRRDEVEQFAVDHPDAPIELLPYTAPDALATHLLSADVHLMSLDKRWEGCMIPSKVQAICQLGRPLLFVGGRNNSPSEWIVRYEAGWVVDEKDAAGLQQALQEMRDPLERARRGAGARRLAQEQFDATRNGERLCDLIEQQEN
ncbi:MAG: glycosyltransferase family 4 protein [Lentisphaerae bacterium]|nr:glycosyltransferase family 4 protein [Lentisphaerota bacterium]